MQTLQPSMGPSVPPSWLLGPQLRPAQATPASGRRSTDHPRNLVLGRQQELGVPILQMGKLRLKEQRQLRTSDLR